MSHEETLIRLHESKSAKDLAKASFDFINVDVPSFAQFLTLRPLEFELPSFGSDPKLQKDFDSYIAGGHKNDIWLRRGRIDPTVRVLRHSDHTPLHILKRSTFYKQVMSLGGCDYGASLVAWRGNDWLSTLTLFRTAQQGDFTDAEVALLLKGQRHFESAVKRVAELHEAKQGSNSLEVFIWSLPTAAVILSWDLAVLHHNAAAQDISSHWRFGDKAQALKTQKTFQMPGDIVERIRQEKGRIPDVSPTRHNRPKIFSVFSIEHPTIEGLTAKVSFLPSQALGVTRGTFLVSLHQEKKTTDERIVFEAMSKLSRRERTLVDLALQGKNSVQISKELNTASGTIRIQFSSIYKKLNIHSRFELLSLVQSSQASSVTSLA